MSADNHTSGGLREMFLRTIAVIGLLAILILGAWGIILLATYLPTAFNGSNDEEQGYVYDSEDYEDTDLDEDEVPVVVTAPVKPVVPVKPVATKPVTPTVSYVPAAQTRSYYGLPDLAVRINSVTPAGGNRVNVQFAVQNLGGNVAQSGWMFEARIPWGSGTYPYISAGQRALNPGDQVYYTLGFDRTTSYSYDYDNDRDSDECDVDDRRDWDEDDWFDWYDENCGDNYCDSDWDNDYDRDEVRDFDEDDWQDWFDDYCDEDNGDDDDDRDHSRYPVVGSQNFTVTVDPQGRVYETNRSNNSASTRI